MFPQLIRAKYHQNTLSLSNSRFLHKSTHVNFADTVDLFKIPDEDEPFWKGHAEASLQNTF